MRPRLLDLFCGAGGAAMGYSRAGFDVVGVDIKPQHYPFEFWQADALWVLDEMLGCCPAILGPFDAIHASPPCQAYTKAQRLRANEHPDLIARTRARLKETGLPYVIENVPGAPLIAPAMLCGAAFPELSVYRHRMFETSFPLPHVLHAQHGVRQTKMGRKPVDGEFIQVVGHFAGIAKAGEAMGIDWMTRADLSQAIPPAYTDWIGCQLMVSLGHVPRPWETMDAVS